MERKTLDKQLMKLKQAGMDEKIPFDHYTHPHRLPGGRLGAFFQSPRPRSHLMFAVSGKASTITHTKEMLFYRLCQETDEN